MKLFLKHPDDRAAERYFSIVNPPGRDRKIEIATRISQSGFKKTLAGLERGDPAEITRIDGEFTPPEDMSRL